MMMKIFVIAFLLFSTTYAFDYRAYDIGGGETGSQSFVELQGEKYMLLPFSTLEVSKDDANLDGDFTLLVGKVNGKSVEPIKVASNYKDQLVVVKLYHEGSFVAQSGEIYLDTDVKSFHIEF